MSRKIMASLCTLMIMCSGMVMDLPACNYHLCNAIEANAESMSAEEFLQSADSSKNITIYDGSTKNAAFNMNGYSFYQGLVFNDEGEVNYNVENVDEISFTVGHIDNTLAYDHTMTVYLDDKKYDSLSLYGTMPLKEYEIDTSKAKVLRIVLSDQVSYPHTGSYALGEMSMIPADKKDIIYGDANGDGEFTIADVVLLQKWLLTVPNSNLPYWQAVDLYEDGKIDVFDLVMMKRRLIYAE